jgi:hypothetical protein
LYGPEFVANTPNIGLPGVTSEACAWHQVSGAHPLAESALLPQQFVPGALATVLQSAGLSLDAVRLPQFRQSVGVVNAAIASRTTQEKAQFWNDLIDAGFRSLWTASPYSRPVTLNSQGALLTRTTANKPVQVVELRIESVARQQGDISGTGYDFDPITMDVLVGCNVQGESPQYTLRTRIEHGTVISPVTNELSSITDPARYIAGFSSWDDAALECHALIPNSQTFSGQLESGGPINAVEARIYLEVIGAGGTVIESVLVPAFNYNRNSFFGGLGVRWSWSRGVSEIHLNASINFVFQNAIGSVGTTDAEDQSGLNPGIGTDLRVARHLFKPLASAGSQIIGVSLPRANRHSVRARHRQFHIETTTTSNGVTLTPAIPVDVSPYCDQSHEEYEANQQPDRWPWRKTNCTVWRRHGGRVTQGRPQLSECLLTITTDPAWVGWDATFYPLGTLIGGVYNLGKTIGDGTLADNYFWFDDEPNTSVPISATSTAYLRRIEFSLMVGAGLAMPPCGTLVANWQVRAFLRGRAVFQVDETSPLSRFFSASLQFGDDFLRGTPVNSANQLFNFAGSLGFGNVMQWYLGGPSDPFVRIGGAGTFFGSSLDTLKPVSELTLQLVE